MLAHRHVNACRPYAAHTLCVLSLHVSLHPKVEESESESDETDDDEVGDDDDMTGMETPMTGMDTPMVDGVSSLMSGLETPGRPTAL